MIVLRVFLPFALGYFLSYLLRVVNAVIAPDLIRDIGLDASDLGLMTSVAFLVFGAFQLPLGILLDRFGPRRTEAVLLGNIAVRYRNTKLTWDPSTMRITNHDEANQWLRRDYRDGWDIEPVV